MKALFAAWIALALLLLVLGGVGRQQLPNESRRSIATIPATAGLKMRPAKTAKALGAVQR